MRKDISGSGESERHKHRNIMRKKNARHAWKWFKTCVIGTGINKEQLRN